MGTYFLNNLKEKLTFYYYLLRVKLLRDGTSSQNRTGTPMECDFESHASTNSAMEAPKKGLTL